MTKSKCGTNSGYSAHYYYKNLPPCDSCKKSRKEYLEKYHKDNPDKRSKNWIEYRKRNPDYKKNYHKDNPEQSRQHARRRRARLRGVESQSYTESEVLDLYGFSCHLCGDLIDLDAPRMQGKDGWEKGLHLDHLIPISAGGTNTIENIRPAHALCNLRKGIQWNTPEEN